MKDHNYYVYILTNWNDEVMYVGMTNNLERRIYEHKHKLVEGFTRKYNLFKLVYYEQGSDVNAVIAREKEIKKWRREKKDNLVKKLNPEWKDLSLEWNAPESHHPVISIGDNGEKPASSPVISTSVKGEKSVSRPVISTSDSEERSGSKQTKNHVISTSNSEEKSVSTQ